MININTPNNFKNIELWNGDCLELMNNIPDNYIDLIFTSPPYYNAKDYSFYKSYEEYLEFINQTIKQYFRVLNNDGFFILNTSPVITSRLSRNSESTRHPIPFDTYQIAKENGFKYIDDIIWEKPDGASNRGRKFSENRRPMAYKPFTITEYLFVFRKNNAPLIDVGIRKHSKDIINKSLVEDGYERTNIWKITPSKNKNHPATFPESLAEKVISYYSYIGDIVLDSFLGSGTTGFVAKKLNRKFIGIEMNKVYFDNSVKRILGETQQ